MELVSDAGAYSTDRRSMGFILLMGLSTPLVVIPLFLIFAPVGPFEGAQPAAIAFAIGSILVILLLSHLLKARGYLYKIPLKVYREGILVQPASKMRPQIIRLEGLLSLELWHGIPYMGPSGCTAETAGRTIKSAEPFRDKASLERFVKEISPVLEEAGFKIAKEDAGEGSLRVVFRRMIAPIRA
ncbi:MAG: hypothetical protein V1827_03605 [Candidatus Micrarchaeota archaeon]